jgi:hypothetical protein
MTRCKHTDVTLYIEFRGDSCYTFDNGKLVNEWSAPNTTLTNNVVAICNVCQRRKAFKYTIDTSLLPEWVRGIWEEYKRK